MYKGYIKKTEHRADAEYSTPATAAFAEGFESPCFFDNMPEVGRSFLYYTTGDVNTSWAVTSIIRELTKSNGLTIIKTANSIYELEIMPEHDS